MQMVWAEPSSLFRIDFIKSIYSNNTMKEMKKIECIKGLKENIKDKRNFTRIVWKHNFIKTKKMYTIRKKYMLAFF